MLKIKSLKISNIGRFVGDHTINLSDKSNFVQVDSNNLNTAGSSGGGKSTIFSAIEYVLGLNDTPSTVLQSRLTKSPMSAEIVLDKNGAEYRISRHKTDGLSISGAGVEVSGSTKVAEEELDKILGIPRSLIRPMFHKRQGERGFFLSKTPKQAHEFLMECLGMSSLESRADKIEAEIKAKEAGLIEETQKLSADMAALQATTGVLDSMVEPKCDVDEVVLSGIYERLQGLKRTKDELAAKMQAEMSSIRPPEPFQYQEDRRVTDALNQLQNKFQASSAEYRDLENTISHLKTNIAVDQKHVEITRNAVQSKDRVSSELNALKAQIVESMKQTCPTCKQHVEDQAASSGITADLVGSAKKKKAELDAILSMESSLPAIVIGIEDNQKALAAAVSKRTSVEADMGSVKNEILMINQARERRQKEAAELYAAAQQSYKTDLDAVAKRYGERLQELENQIEAHNQAYHRGQANLRSYQDAMRVYGTQKEVLENKLSVLRTRIVEIEDRTRGANARLAVMRASVKLIKSYANQLFQDSLAVVADTASKILSRIPNMSTATITFDAFKETKAGSLKEEVVPILSMDDEINVPIKSMSGGERAAVDLAVDLAVIDMIESKTGNGIDLFILDEPFDGLDAICRENCLEVLKNHASQRKILIVDHSTETKQMVQDKIVVVRDGQMSRFDDTL